MNYLNSSWVNNEIEVKAKTSLKFKFEALKIIKPYVLKVLLFDNIYLVY